MMVRMEEKMGGKNEASVSSCCKNAGQHPVDFQRKEEHLTPLPKYERIASKE